ncbi:MAG: DUF1304 domain-containing protein [Sedimentitalea sp.]
MKTVGLALVALIAALHVYIAWFEIFAWTTVAPSVFKSMDPAIFEPTVKLGANQGVYNLFLAIGLGWSLVIKDAQWQRNIATCFLAFVAIAGAFAAITVEVRPGLMQLVPSVIALALLHMNKESAG